MLLRPCCFDIQSGQPKWISRAHMCPSSLQRPYALAMLSGVSHSLNTGKHHKGSYKLTSGLQESATSTTKLQSFRKAVVVSQICWAVAIGLVKFSILAFYWRVFIQQSQTRATAVTIWFLTAIVACWGIATVGPCPQILNLINN